MSVNESQQLRSISIAINGDERSFNRRLGRNVGANNRFSKTNPRSMPSNPHFICIRNVQVVEKLSRSKEDDSVERTR